MTTPYLNEKFQNEKFQNEKFRPQFHFTPSAHWMNDPNGMVYFEGEYHLFYQHHPNGTTWGPMHWGHAVSSDLVHWEHLPIALKPDHNGFIFSGSAVVDWKDSSGLFGGRPGLVAIFTHADQYPDSDRPRQRQSLAYSTDQGRSWTMYENNPVLANELYTDFRDPKVFWHEQKQHWVMVLAAGDHVQFYTSNDLKSWTFASEFGTAEGSHEGVWECPDLIELPVEGSEGECKWVLIVSIGDHPDHPEGSRTQYFIGQFDGMTFTNENAADTVLWLDHGRDNYAGVTWSDVERPDQAKLFIGWMSNWKYCNLTPTKEWRSAMTLPRELRLRRTPSGIRVVQQPVSELQELRQQEQSRQWGGVTIRPGDNLLKDVKGDRYELICEFDVGSAEEVGLHLRTSDTEKTVVGYRAAERKLFVCRTHSGESAFHPGFACRHDARLEPLEGRIHLHLFVDHSSIEIFANHGEVAVTDQIFPDPSSVGLELYARGGEATIHRLDFHPLQSIYSYAPISRR
ncbi:glycoside hydrolase family 32 protein [Paenibacillus mucilaginosus]|uniref:SacC n=1 Tax=Paenibacillus mucilaginosus (strain KNP414) TaxID=1036673 RepID=F8FR06_PAEMK|nr:glycoside hydrolase family 32 protein [Paenibacillus mucilaginosus]AEI40444.1 SacC [Paenibacillus mucilaginosus KNP414]MCG7213212.1 glycoside hydrolase family 32 protein [Paenibacillus mucilaginosus]WDM29622.1 glycoside hydrolase family 32 protein [Paenibacillus mucilaginosus]